jgi:hypothetical protein
VFSRQRRQSRRGTTVGASDWCSRGAWQAARQKRTRCQRMKSWQTRPLWRPLRVCSHGLSVPVTANRCREATNELSVPIQRYLLPFSANLRTTLVEVLTLLRLVSVAFANQPVSALASSRARCRAQERATSCAAHERCKDNERRRVSSARQTTVES